MTSLDGTHLGRRHGVMLQPRVGGTYAARKTPRERTTGELARATSSSRVTAPRAAHRKNPTITRVHGATNGTRRESNLDIVFAGVAVFVLIQREL